VAPGHRSYGGGLERRDENPTVDLLDRLAATLEVSVSEFFKLPRKPVYFTASFQSLLDWPMHDSVWKKVLDHDA
jgi:transcriptional regulator with XRE-family HTH domain